MDDVSELQARTTTNPRYVTAAAYAQAGRWAEAIEAFEKLARDYPGDRLIEDALVDARFRAHLDEGARIGSRRWVVNWRPVVIRLLIVLAIGALAWQGAQIVKYRFLPAQAQARAERIEALLLSEAGAQLEAGDLDGAEARFRRVLASEPDHEQALQGLAEITEERALQSLYADAVARQEAGDYAAALETLTELAGRSPGYLDVDERIAAVRRAYELEMPFAEAEADYEAGRVAQAIDKYEQIRAANASYRRDIIVGRLAELYVQQGRTLVDAAPSSSGPEAVKEALAYFQTALDLQPRSDEAVWELRRANSYLEGYAAYREGRWDQAISSLRAVYEERSSYLGGTLAELLYETLLHSGDRLLGTGDLFLAYERYREASRLPVADEDSVQARMDTVQAIFTPTPEPAVTATPQSTPTPEPEPASAPAAVATRVLAATPTPTPAPAGGPLTVVYPYFYVIDRRAIFGTEDWEAHLGVFFTGGLPPYEFALEGGRRQSVNSLRLRWKICRPAPLTVHVWSADGQEAEQSIWVDQWCP